MQWIDDMIAVFRAEVTRDFGDSFEVALLSTRWTSMLAPLAQPEGAVTWVPEHASERDAHGYDDDGPGSTRAIASDWVGRLDLWPGAPQHVVVRRSMAPAGMRRAVVTIAAGRTHAAIAAVMDHNAELWKQWRRDRARIRGPRGQRLELAPTAWSDLCLPVDLVDDVRDDVTRFAKAREVYARCRLPHRRGLLFFGPPGNGKTMLCKAIATTLDWPITYVAPDGDPDAIKVAFAEARMLAPCVVWLDDIDTYLDERKDLGEFLNVLDGAGTLDGVLVIATTNRPEKLDPAIVARPSRFDRLIEIGLPGPAERDRYLAARFGDRLTLADRSDLVERTAGMSMAFLQELFISSALRAMDRGELPNGVDARETLAAIGRHARTAAGGFEPIPATGFGRKGRRHE